VEHLEVSPEAIYQRMNKHAHVFLNEMIQQAFANIHAEANRCDEGLFPFFTQVYIADSTGFELPDSLKNSFPGAGGSAAKAGAKIQAVWDYTSRVFAPCVLTPWNIPDQKYIDNVVALACKAALFIFDLGYFKIQAFARLAAADAYFFS